MRTLLILAATIVVTACNSGTAQIEEQTAKPDATLEVAERFLTAAGSGDMETLSELMADDFVWHNEGDDSLPWIGDWEGKETVLNTFLPSFGAGLRVTGWTTDYSFSSGDQAAFMGTMSANATNSGAPTGTMSWAVRVHVVDGKVKSWNWFEDSYAVSSAFHADAQ